MATLLDKFSSSSSLSLPKILVADTNNRRIQCFSIEFNGQFLYEHTFKMKEKPYFIETSNRHFAVSCENGLIRTFLVKEKRSLAKIDLNRTPMVPSNIFHLNQELFFVFLNYSILDITHTALPFCMDPENSFLFISNSILSVSIIHQLTVTGEYLRSIKIDRYPFLRISSLIFDNYDQQLIIVDSFNSVIYSVEHDLDEDNVEILLKRSDSLNSPQALCISNEGHLVVAEYSVTTQHTLKIFRYHPCSCHSRIPTSSVKTSETTSIRSMIFPY